MLWGWMDGEVFVEPVRLPCLHAFCKACILQNEEIQTKCPLCRVMYTFGRKDTILTGCIQNIIESAYNQNEMTRTDELVAARKDLKSLMKERKKKKRRTKILEGLYSWGFSFFASICYVISSSDTSI